MTTYTMRPHRRKPFRLAQILPDLFAWADAQNAPACLTESLAIRSIARRYGVPVHLARVYAEHSGLGGRS